jgi:hypothetical protein
MPALFYRLAKVELPLFQGQGETRSDYVHLVGLNQHPIPDLMHGHGGVPGKNLRHEALMLGRQVLDHDIGHPGVDRRVPEEGLQGFNSSGGGADTDDGE